MKHRAYFVLFFIIFLLSTGLLMQQIFKQRSVFSGMGKSLIDYREASRIITPIPTPKLKPTLQPLKVTPSVKPIKGTRVSISPTLPQPWGVAQKVDDVTYTIRVGEDESMASPQEVLVALNNYRNVNGKSSLTWSDQLAAFAQTRAQYFSTISGTDKHAGFDSYLNNENGFEALGFRRVGENSYFGGKLNGVHMIEWVFAKSPGHNANQLDSQWTHVGIGITNNAANLNFGGEKL